MPIPLDDWQELLEGHFTDLAEARSQSGFPLFAFEHGLSHENIEEIGTLLRRRLAEGKPLGSRHWLIWVVYATELGYGYDGDEYWRSFEDATPHWRQNTASSRRNRLREWFSRFQTNFHGVEPSGPWAEHFSIIAWPITHAILPKFLQWQFARTLFTLRYQLAHLDSLSPRYIGSLLAANAWETSSRFREFIQQEELAGRIVLALLTDRQVEGESPIYLPTLERLASDLEEVQSTREWLKETRYLVADRLKGMARNNAEDGATSVDKNAAGSGETPLRIRPTITLSRTSSTNWSSVITIPSFAGMGRFDSDLRAFLANTRCQIAGTGDTWLHRGWLLSGPRKRSLKTWPKANAPLITFEQANPTAEQLVNSEAPFLSKAISLYRIVADGTARETLGGVVRPGGSYILLSEVKLTGHALLSECTIGCDGVHAARLSLPVTLSSEITAELKELGLQVARTLRIWPAGLCSRAWDGGGHSEWLTTESPTFGIVHNHPLDLLRLRLDYDTDISIKAGNVGAPTFVQIPPLPVGTHTLSVRGRRQGYIDAEGVVTLDVRPPEPWVPGTTTHAGLTISVEPYEPSLDDFWEGNVALSVLGPVGHSVACAISLVGSNGAELRYESVGIFTLPLAAADWSKKYSQFVKDDSRAWSYLQASAGRLTITGEELGEYSVRLERQVKPVRWACRTAHDVTTIRLIDDTGRDGDAECRFFSFARPVDPTILTIDAAHAGFDIQPPGGLFEAQNGTYVDTIIVSPQLQGGLPNLIAEPDLYSLDGDNADMFQLLNFLRLWTEARAVGPLAGLRHARVIIRLLSRFYFRLCGCNWTEAEAHYINNPHSESALQHLQRSVGGPPGFAAILRREYAQMEGSTASGTGWFTDIAARYLVCTEGEGFCEFALRVASQPCQLLRWPRPALKPLFNEIKQHGVLMRGARFIAVLSAMNQTDSSCIPVPRWQWPLK
jgi:hypothetical protein